MKLIDDKLVLLKDEVASLAEHCEALGDEKTRQLLLEVEELLTITHDTFIGKTLTNLSMHQMGKHRKH